MSELEQRKLVVAEAMSWLRTPWHDNARLKGIGVDCAQLPAAVYEAAGVIEHIEPKYVKQWSLNRSEELYVEWVLKVGGREIERPQIAIGDLALWKFGRTFSHGGIFISDTQIVHAMNGVGVTIDEFERLSELVTRKCRYFTLWGGA